MRDKVAIFDPKVMKEILGVTCSILERNFFYAPEELNFFLETFAEGFSEDIVGFESYAEKEILAELHRSKKARNYFTCYLVSAHLRDIFINEFHFSEQELEAFENILPKYAGEKRHEHKSRKQRKKY
jgi:hypothetical protein